MLTEREAFKVGFLSRCVEEGLSTEETQQRVKIAAEKLANAFSSAIGAVGGAAKPIVGNALGWGIPLALAAPPIAGGLAGFLASQTTDIDDTDIDEVKQRELIDEYKRQTQKMRHDNQIRKYRTDRKQTGRVFL